MEIHPIDVKTRAELRSWFEKNAEKESFCWVVCKRGKECPNGVLSYAEVVEESLCFGWIDSTCKKYGELHLQRISKRRKNSHWSELNKLRAKRLESLGLMTDAGRKALHLSELDK